MCVSFYYFAMDVFMVELYDSPKYDSNFYSIGCAYVATTCSRITSAYGVNWVTYTSNTVSQSNLVAHEVRFDIVFG